MKCTQEGCDGSLHVLSSSSSVPGHFRRTRKCTKCGFRATTMEHITESDQRYTPVEDQIEALIALAAGGNVREVSASGNAPKRLVIKFAQRLREAKAAAKAAAKPG